ncbi:hypothetical protein MLD38_025312 [Melastoma candidum]|uniref:Uncharacterized protein n=1 Tax=Melastoma candidum TaxID=119954 RepID=A0ACB9NUP4_9MYRT|nr:hypothetical protein MLD38_025312 [Melastoma candidum]
MAALGGIVEVKGNENSLKADGLAQFAVEDRNKKQVRLFEGSVKVLSTKQLVVAGTMHHITLEAVAVGGVKQPFKAKVWVKPWENFKEVQEFKLIGDSPTEGSA